MALPENHPLNEVVVSAFKTDLSAAGSWFAVAPVRGRIIKTWIVNYTATSVAADTITMEINGVPVTGISISTGIAAPAGSVFTGVPTGANAVSEGDAIEWISDGLSTGISQAMGFALIRTN